MKKLYIFIICSVIASCSNNDDNLTITYGNSKITMHTSDFVNSENKTRSVLEPANNGISFKWKSGDIASVYSNENGMTNFNIDESSISADGKSANFSGSGFLLHPNTSYYTFFPYNSSNLNKETIKVKYWGQNINTNGDYYDLSNYDYMYARNVTDVNGSTSFEYNHLSTVVRFLIKVPEDGIYTSMRIESTGSETELISEGIINIASNTPQINKYHTDSLYTVSFNVPDGLKLKKDSILCAYLMMAPQNLNGVKLRLRLIDNDAKWYETYFTGVNMYPGYYYTYNVGNDNESGFTGTGNDFVSGDFNPTFVSSYSHPVKKQYEDLLYEQDYLYAVGTMGIRKISYANGQTPTLVAENTQIVGNNMKSRALAIKDQYIYCTTRVAGVGGSVELFIPQIRLKFEEGINLYGSKNGEFDNIENEATVIVRDVDDPCPNTGSYALNLCTIDNTKANLLLEKNIQQSTNKNSISLWINLREANNDEKITIPIARHNDNTIESICLSPSGVGYKFALLCCGNFVQGETTFQKGVWYNIKVNVQNNNASLYWRDKECSDWHNEMNIAVSGFEMTKLCLGMETLNNHVDLLIDDFYFNETELDDVSYINGKVFVLNKEDLSIVKTMNMDLKGTGVVVNDDVLLVNFLYGCNIYDVSNPADPKLKFTYRFPEKEFQGGDLFKVDGVVYAFICNYSKGYTVVDVTNSKIVTYGKNDFLYQNLRYNSKGYNFDVIVDYPFAYATYATGKGYLGTQYDRKGVLVYNLSNLNNITQALYPIPEDDCCTFASGDIEPSRISRSNNKLILNNAEKGVVVFDIQNDGSPLYKCSIQHPSQSVVNAITTSENGYLFMGDGPTGISSMSSRDIFFYMGIK